MSRTILHSTFKAVVGCVAIFFLIAGYALADSTLTESFNINGTIQSAAPSGQFTLPDFDTTLGTLEGVDITLTVDSCAKIQVYNSSSAAVGFTNASLTMPISISGPSNLGLSTALGASLDSGTAQPGMNTYGGVHSTNTLSQELDSNSFNLWENQANSVVDFTYVKGNPTSQGTDLGNSLYFGGTVGGTGNVTVQYTYLSTGVVATPEPSGKYLSFIVACAMMLLLVGRKRLLCPGE